MHSSDIPDHLSDCQPSKLDIDWNLSNKCPNDLYVLGLNEIVFIAPCVQALPARRGTGPQHLEWPHICHRHVDTRNRDAETLLIHGEPVHPAAPSRLSYDLAMSDFSGAGLVVLGLYFLPSIIALARKVKNAGSVVVTNLFLGWTVIGWIIALAMAARTDKKTSQGTMPTTPPVTPPVTSPAVPPTQPSASSSPLPPPSTNLMTFAQQAGSEWGKLQLWIRSRGESTQVTPGNKSTKSRLWLLLVIPGLVVFYLVMPKENSSNNEGSTSPSADSTTSTPATSTTQPSRPWTEMLLAGQDIDALTTASCSQLESVLTKQAKVIADRLEATKIPSNNAYDSAEFIKSVDWTIVDHSAVLTNAQLEVVDSVVNPSVNQALDETQRLGFLNDSLTACSLSEIATDVTSDADTLDKRLALMTVKAKNLPWYPKGFNLYEEDIAWRWAERGEFRCSFGDICWGIFIVARNGCPSMLYAEITILDAAGTNIGFTNDTASSLRSGDEAKLVFEDFTPGADSARLAEISCY